jgi:biotin carboxylase
MTPLGVVDSHFYPGTLSFQRFEYPSRLPPGVQERMALIAERCVKAIGLDRTFFNIEFFYHPETDHIWTIEVNGRMSSQFTPLYRMVHGIDIYAMQLDMALGRSPKGNMIWAPGRNGTVAASFVLRSFEDRLVLQAPSDEDLERVKRQCPEVFVEVLVHEGHRLSDELQDDESYRYALVDLCAKGWESLSQRFEEVRQLLPFTLAPPPVAVQKR